jgi:uncharacterized protein
MMVALNGQLDIVNVLLKHGASVDKSIVDGGETPILMAAQNGHLDIMKVLVEHGASVDKPNVDGETPMLMAA